MLNETQMSFASILSIYFTCLLAFFITKKNLVPYVMYRIVYMYEIWVWQEHIPLPRSTLSRCTPLFHPSGTVPFPFRFLSFNFSSCTLWILIFFFLTWFCCALNQLPWPGRFEKFLLPPSCSGLLNFRTWENITEIICLNIQDPFIKNFVIFLRSKSCKSSLKN